MRYSFLIVLLSSCTPTYICLIRNDTPQNMFVRTWPPIESNYVTNTPYYDSLIAWRVDQGDDSAYYRVMPGQEVTLSGRIGTGPTESSFPFHRVVMTNATDTITLRSKKEILSTLKNEDGSRIYVIHYRGTKREP